MTRAERPPDERRCPSLARVAAVTAAIVTLEVGCIAGLAALLGMEVSSVNGLLLLSSVGLLGAVWATRHCLRGGRSACLSAAAVPLVAAAMFVLPKLWLGPPGPAVLTLAVLLCFAPLLERAWAIFVLPADRGAGPLRLALATAAPPIGVALLSTLATQSPLMMGLAASGVALSLFAATRVFLDAQRAEREARAYAAHLSVIEVRTDALVRPRPPLLTDPWLIELEQALEGRAVALSRQAVADDRARSEIAVALSLRTRFMAAMSHELRSPLNSIVGFAQLLQRGLEGELTPGQGESVAMVQRSAEELILLLTDVLDLARLEAGRLRLRRAWTPSVEILTEAVSRAQGIVMGRQVEIQAELQPGLPPVYVDQRRIVQAVVALFRNAALSLNKTTIRLRARVALGPPGPERHLRVEIHDAIGAIPRDEIERIFDVFREITEPTGRRASGLGMALALSRGLVRLHGGEVWADSIPGAGTILCVALPLDERRDFP